MPLPRLSCQQPTCPGLPQADSIISRLQGTVVSFDSAHSPANASHVPLPRLDITRLPWVWGGEPFAVWGARWYAAAHAPPLQLNVWPTCCSPACPPARLPTLR